MDIILYNGHIRTLYDEEPTASAIAIRDGKVIAVGDDDLKALAGADTELIDLDGKSVLPGLTDAHVHLSWYAAYLNEVDVRGTKSAREAAETVAAFAADAPPDEWIRGRGWGQNDWPGGNFPTADDLADIQQPVYLVAHSGHAGWANRAALKRAGITADTPNPEGGQIQRDERGQPTGILFETAMELVSEVIPRPTAEQLADQIQQAIARAHRGGLTGLHDFDGRLAFRAYQLLHERGDLNFRIVKNLPVALLDHAIETGLRWGFGDDMLRIGGVKSFADGALGSRTAWMIEPYEGEPDNTGICVTAPEQLMIDVRRASENGLPSTIHAIGDMAVHQVLNVYETIRREERDRGVSPQQMRHRIEHVQVIHPDDVERLGQLQVIASMQPNHATSDMDAADNLWGDRATYSYNWRMQADAGAPLAFGSDAPIEPIEPLPNIQAAVTRRRLDGYPGDEGWRPGPGGSYKLTVDEAMHGFTTGAAYAAGMEDRLGRLAPGYLADLVILGQDIYTCDPMAIAETPVLGTLVNGAWVYRDF